MKYIDADKLIAEIERRLKILEPHKDTFESAAACRQELIWMKEFIASQPGVDLVEFVKSGYELGLNARKEKSK